MIPDERSQRWSERQSKRARLNEGGSANQHPSPQAESLSPTPISSPSCPRPGLVLMTSCTFGTITGRTPRLGRLRVLPWSLGCFCGSSTPRFKLQYGRKRATVNLLQGFGQSNLLSDRIPYQRNLLEGYLTLGRLQSTSYYGGIMCSDPLYWLKHSRAHCCASCSLHEGNSILLAFHFSIVTLFMLFSFSCVPCS